MDNKISFEHEPVLLKECIENLSIKPDGVYVDCTLGGAGHSKEIFKTLSENGVLIGIDQDINAIKAAKDRLYNVNSKGRFIAINANFENIREILNVQKINSVDGILMDLGVSSYQLDTVDRGFSYNHNSELDMRMNQDSSFSAKEVVNTYSKEELSQVIREYGEENWALRISEFIVNARQNKKIETTGELVDIIKAAVPKNARRDGPHPAKRTFQAIRIEVNSELEVLKKVLPKALESLSSGGRLLVITFHSLEDRIVKNFMKSKIGKCKCPSDFPMCICGAKEEIKIISRKPILPNETELNINPRARSAKLRVCEKI